MRPGPTAPRPSAPRPAQRRRRGRPDGAALQHREAAIVAPAGGSRAGAAGPGRCRPRAAPAVPARTAAVSSRARGRLRPAATAPSSNPSATSAGSPGRCPRAPSRARRGPPQGGRRPPAGAGSRSARPLGPDRGPWSPGRRPPPRGGRPDSASSARGPPEERRPPGGPAPSPPRPRGARRLPHRGRDLGERGLGVHRLDREHTRSAPAASTERGAAQIRQRRLGRWDGVGQGEPLRQAGIGRAPTPPRAPGPSRRRPPPDTRPSRRPAGSTISTVEEALLQEAGALLGEHLDVARRPAGRPCRPRCMPPSRA